MRYNGISENLYKYKIGKVVIWMKVIRKLVLKYGSAFAALAMMIGISSSTKACWFWYNQPKVPEGMKKFTNED